MGVYIKGITIEMLRNAPLEAVEDLLAEGDMVEVKEPHGRLIDADVTRDRLLNIMCGTGYQSRAIIAAIDEYITPTVIESEV